MKLFNTMTRAVEPFKPQARDRVTFYSCGPTVYDYLHIGNWTTYIRWDVLSRILRREGYNLFWVMNITDVGHLTSDADEGEDKLEKGAKREGKSAWAIADYYTQDFSRGLKFLNIELGEHGKLVKATDHIAEQIEVVKKLNDKGYLYKIDGDGMYFDSSKLTDYGKLARLDIKGLQAGKRVAAGNKHNPTDFAVWKFSPEGSKRDMEWDSPFGKGFPGWHLECSAMSMKYLGETLDIHAGGIDHIPVHHTNEIAQSETITGKPLANYWVHSNFLLINEAKIAKSLGNGLRLQDLVEKGFSGQDFRLFSLQSHYRTEATFTFELLAAAKARLARWQAAASLRWQPETSENSKLIIETLETAGKSLQNALSDDLNTPEALRAVEVALDAAQTSGISEETLPAFVEFLRTVQELLGIDLFDEDLEDDQKQTLRLRSQAREAKDWARSDELRIKLERTGVHVNDSNDKQRWYRNTAKD